MARNGKATKGTRGRAEQRLVSFRLPREDYEWFTKQARDHDLSHSALVRQCLDPLRTRFGLPPVLWRELESAMQQEGLTEAQFISEMLRREAERMIEQKRQAAGEGPECRRTAAV
jgi:hypothetical protein